MRLFVQPMDFEPDAANRLVAPITIPAAGSYTGPLLVALFTPTPNAAIYYTTDGSEPNKQSAKYKGAFTLAASGAVKAIAVAGKDADKSPVASAVFTLV